MVILMVIQTIRLAPPEPNGTDGAAHMSRWIPLEPTSQKLVSRLRIWRLGFDSLAAL